ncbi:uncharacterized protein LOC141590205 [Silene latifolia]|uniref:uncharacterized protein LOC141590205 n=1 Tax=Silene latifolia TaxID=37657 RepID=UPI003D76E4FB
MVQATGFPDPFIKILMQCITTPTYYISLNGETFGFFKGRKGLRRDRGSVGLMVTVFDHFSKSSGLLMNREKSNFCSNGIDKTLVNEIEEKIGMKRGQVPFKYSGVNISPTRLSIMDCECLVEKIMDKIRSLGSRKLSYAGPICGMALIIKRAPPWFLGQKFFNLRNRGGLGFKDLHTWNVATIGKYVWWVSMKADHLWVRWVHAVYIKNLVWKDYEPGSGNSWASRQICQVKNTYKANLFSDINVEHYSIKEGYHWLRPIGEKVLWNQCRLMGYLLRPQVLVNNVKREVKVPLNQYDVKCRNGRVIDWMNYISSQ